MMSQDQVKKIVIKTDEEKKPDIELSIMELFLKEKPKLKTHVVKFGFGLRKPHELAEDFTLQTPLE